MSKSDRKLCNGEWIQILKLKKNCWYALFNKRGTHKWLGLLFDSKLTFLSHIKMLQYKCLKTLNIYQNVCPVPTG
jgi:hypothetical protein